MILSKCEIDSHGDCTFININTLKLHKFSLYILYDHKTCYDSIAMRFIILQYFWYFEKKRYCQSS